MNTIAINPPKTIGQLSAETAALIKHLETVEVGQVVTYAEMKQACKVSPQENPAHLITARRTLMKSRVVFGTIIGIGIKRLANDEIPDDAKNKQDRARRVAKKGLAVLNCADIATLESEQKIKAITTRTVLGFMASAGSRKVCKLAEQAVRVSNGEMKIGDISSLFLK